MSPEAFLISRSKHKSVDCLPTANTKITGRNNYFIIISYFNEKDLPG